uniref:hypothetical protein n=1 Tax=Clostridium sp. 12(A) TaxID=1163671 RepID=UPI0004643851|nr:hypothetical protein [Clostridium sp. 12(A)]
MSAKKDCSLSDVKLLRELILENPELPLIIFCGEDSWSGEHAYEQVNASKGEIESLILYGDTWLTEEDYAEKLTDDLSDEEEYKNLSDEEYREMIDRKVSASEFIKAIVIWIG